MKLKNTGNKLVSVGETVILPGETKEVTGFINNAALNCLVKSGDLSVVKEKPTGKGK